MSTDREEAIANARAKHLRKHPEKTEPAEGERAQQKAAKVPAPKIASKAAVERGGVAPKPS